MSDGPGDRFERSETLLLGGPPTLTRRQVVERAGVEPAFADRLWNAMGFVSRGDDEVVFTEADVDALRAVHTLTESGAIAPEEAIALARIHSQHLAALAEAEASLAVERAGGAVERIDVTENLAQVQHLLLYMWHRQLLASMLRHAATAGQGDAGTVGFADLVGFTSLTRGMQRDALLALVDRFEAETRQRVTEGGGRIVKTIGDEVMFTVATPGQGAAIALDLVDIGNVDGLPPIRVGLAHGDVLLRHGDVFGEVVNIAARLVSLARPGTVLVDRNAAQVLEGDGRWELVKLRPRRVRGYEHLAAHALRRRDGEAPPAA
ncbi:MAG TPA: adenylate/guanylate cyclase domain-containing protein [Candidatus Angelobacter sp.]|nr:adenylate/guanylate cyclase domain-containing protein [Candidatus Angelobacter sp.]